MNGALLVVVVVLQSVTVLMLAVALVKYVRALSDAGARLADAAEQLKTQVVPVVEDLRKTISDADSLVLSAKAGVDSISRVSVSAERLLEVANLLGAAEKAVVTSKVTLGSLLQGIKAGLQALRGKRDAIQEVSEYGA